MDYLSVLVTILTGIAGFGTTYGINILKEIRQELRNGEVRMTKHEGKIDALAENVIDHEQRIRKIEGH